MLDLLTRADNLPFSVALVVVVLLALLQFIGLADMFGADVEFDAHVDAHVHAGGGLSLDAGLLSLFGVGRVPFMMWLMILLGLFALIGLAGQEVLAAAIGVRWPAWAAALGAGGLALPATGALCRPLGRILPQDETSAIEVSALVGREAEIVIGTATPGNPARGRVIDPFGQAHYVMLEPDGTNQRFVQGERVLLIRREAEVFRAVTRGDHYLPRLD